MGELCNIRRSVEDYDLSNSGVDTVTDFDTNDIVVPHCSSSSHLVCHDRKENCVRCAVAAI